MFRYIRLYLLLSVCLGLFAYCTRFHTTTQLGSEGKPEGGNKNPDEYDDEGTNTDLQNIPCNGENCEQAVDVKDMPYDIGMDTMSYLTCDSKNLPDDTFSFKIEALRGGGVRLRKKFVQMTTNKIKKHPYYRTYPALIPIPPRSWWVSPSFKVSYPVPGRFGRLTFIELEDYLDVFLTKKHLFTKEFEGNSIQLGWLANQNLEYSLKNLFDQSDLLVTFYNTSGGDSLPGYRDMNKARETTHGRYYRIGLKEERTYHTLSVITERYPLRDGDEENLWSCGLKFKVKRHDDHRFISGSVPDTNLSEEPGCTDNQGTDDSNITHYNLVRKILKDTVQPYRWNVNTSEYCISLKSPIKSCYTYTAKPKTDSGFNEGKGRVDHSNCNGTHIHRLCPHYLSICTKSFNES